jgi:Prophage CP4-57 regulatory protein (AlpA)
MSIKWLRFADLKARGIITSRPMLLRRIEHDGFPPGRMLGANTRAWPENEIDAWLESRPIGGPGRWRGTAKTATKTLIRQPADGMTP